MDSKCRYKFREKIENVDFPKYMFLFNYSNKIFLK